MENKFEEQYNNRQYKLMLDFLLEYEQRNRNLSSLISNLEAGLSCLENPNQEWKKAFMSQWGILEDTYSFAQHSKQALSENDQRCISNAVEKLKTMLQEKLN